MMNVLDSCVAELRSAIQPFPWDSRPVYGDWLAQTYFYVRHTTRLLAAAAARFELDAFGNALHHRFASHMGEEKKHEQLAIHDLEQIGLSLDQFAERPSTRAFYEAQYYKIEHVHPTAVFGYILPLESLGPACGKFMMETVTASFGPKCAAFLRLHSEEDSAHIEKAVAAIAGVSPAQRAAIEDNMRQTTWCYLAMLDEIRTSATKSPGRRS